MTGGQGQRDEKGEKMEQQGGGGPGVHLTAVWSAAVS